MARSNQKVVPEAKAALDKFKYEVASDMCVKNIFTYLLATSYFFYRVAQGVRPLHIFYGRLKSPLHFLCRLF